MSAYDMRFSDWSSNVCSSDLPTMTARTDQVASVRDAKHVEVAGIGDGGADALIATGRLADFRCCFGQVGGDGTIDAASAGLLGVGQGDAISWIGRYTKGNAPPLPRRGWGGGRR